MASILRDRSNLKTSETICSSLKAIKGEEKYELHLLNKLQTELQLASCHPFLKLASKHCMVPSPLSSLLLKGCIFLVYPPYYCQQQYYVLLIMLFRMYCFFKFLFFSELHQWAAEVFLDTAMRDVKLYGVVLSIILTSLRL